MAERDQPEHVYASIWPMKVCDLCGEPWLRVWVITRTFGWQILLRIECSQGHNPIDLLQTHQITELPL